VDEELPEEVTAKHYPCSKERIGKAMGNTRYALRRDGPGTGRDRLTGFLLGSQGKGGKPAGSADENCRLGNLKRRRGPREQPRSTKVLINNDSKRQRKSKRSQYE